jgi:hypothetical protein
MTVYIENGMENTILIPADKSGHIKRNFFVALRPNASHGLLIHEVF